MRVLVTGATGTLGRSLIERLTEARVLSRKPERVHAVLGDVDARAWDGVSPIAPEAFDDIGAVVHLAGEPVAEGRWTAAKKRAIADSRLLGTRQLVASMANARRRPVVLVNASAVGYYGDRGEERLEESSSPGDDFLANVCVGWEREAQKAEELGVRVVRIRIGVVLDATGGALPRMVAPFRLGLGGTLGDGRQWTPWIHIHDVVGLFLHALAHDVSGPMNAVAPAPVRNAELTHAIAAALGRPARLRVPAIALRAALGEVAAVVMASQRVVPSVAARWGYAFAHPDIERALANLLPTAKPTRASHPAPAKPTSPA